MLCEDLTPSPERLETPLPTTLARGLGARLPRQLGDMCAAGEERRLTPCWCLPVRVSACSLSSVRINPRRGYLRVIGL